jgi:hypothetical protein
VPEPEISREWRPEPGSPEARKPGSPEGGKAVLTENFSSAHDSAMGDGWLASGFGRKAHNVYCIHTIDMLLWTHTVAVV